MRPIVNKTEVLEQFEANPLFWFHYFFPHHVRKESPMFHLELVRAMIANRFLSAAAPRESAKSTILTFVKPFHDICFKKKRFILIISNTFKKASMSLDSIKKELIDNQEFSKWFNLEITKDAEGDSEIRHSDGFTTKILCRGVDQIGSVRGIKFGAYRPDLILGDDMEDDELVKNPIRRSELQQLFDEALIPAGEKGNCQYIFMGTILHDDSLLAKLVSHTNYPEYHKLFYQARYEDSGTIVSLWPEKWSVEELNQMEKDRPSVFAKEYQNDPVSGANARFKKENFRQWSIIGNDYVLHNEYGETISRGRFSDCLPAISCDLAWKEKRESDSCVIMPGLLTPSSEILIEDYICEKGLRPDDIAEHLFIMTDRLQKLTGISPSIGFEKAMLENVTKWFLKQEMRKRNKFLVTKELVWDADKITRIETRLIPRYSQHVIFHKKGMGDLEHQLERFPYGAHDDLIDAEQGLVQLLQYPRSLAKPEKAKDEFDWWRQQVINAKKRVTHGFSGSKYQTIGIPAIKSWR